MKLNWKLIWTAMLFIYIAAVAHLCFMRPENLPQVSPDIFGIPLDKVVHFLMFFPFPIMAYMSFRPLKRNRFIHLAVLFVMYAVGVGLAIGTEHIQGQLGYRSEDIHDIYADFSGITLSALLTAVYILSKKRKK